MSDIVLFVWFGSRGFDMVLIGGVIALRKGSVCVLY